MTKYDGIQKRYRHLQRLIQPFGLEILQKASRAGVYDATGDRVYVLPSSPRNLGNAERYAVQHLKRLGHIPKEVEV